MKVFITGGAGFIGSNCADHFLQEGHKVTIFDNFSRVGSQINLDWLQGRHGSQNLEIIRADIRDFSELQKTIPGADAVLHLASQVAVTTSVKDPREDFQINALGTFNVLEAVRHHCPEAVFIYSSTNKVYGGMEELNILEKKSRYDYADYPQGIPESYPLDFHSPYGCSKGSGDQYTRDYARIYGLKTVTFRQSCIYGRRQFGVEDQGWVAHFVIAAVMNRPITIYGDGKQMRDLLHVSDLIRAYAMAIDQIGQIKGQVFNLGGGPANTISIWAEFKPLLESLTGHPISVQRGNWRPGDQRVFVADIGKISKQIGWQPSIPPSEGIADLYQWVSTHRHLF